MKYPSKFVRKFLIAFLARSTVLKALNDQLMGIEVWEKPLNNVLEMSL